MIILTFVVKWNKNAGAYPMKNNIHYRTWKLIRYINHLDKTHQCKQFIINIVPLEPGQQFAKVVLQKLEKSKYKATAYYTGLFFSAAIPKTKRGQNTYCFRCMSIRDSCESMNLPNIKPNTVYLSVMV